MIKNENVEGEPAYDETYRRGPVVMRGPMIPKDNTYANLLGARRFDRLAACRSLARAAHSGRVCRWLRRACRAWPRSDHLRQCPHA